MVLPTENFETIRLSTDGQADIEIESQSCLVTLKQGILLSERYVTEKLLGRGGMGEVWLASEYNDGHKIQDVVVKIIPAEIQDNSRELVRMRESFDLIRQLRHTNICSALTFARDEKYGYFIVMDYVHGIELCDYQSQQPNGIFSLDATIEILSGVASALDYAHKKRVLHRDIKPQNVMIPIENNDLLISEAKLIDFGLAVRCYATNANINLEPEDKTTVSGTLPYMPPEQINGEHQDARTDQYALGVMAYEMLSGQVPFSSPAPSVFLHQILNCTPPPIENLSELVNQVLCKAMAKDRKQRYGTCMEFVQALYDAALKSGDKNRLASVPPLPRALQETGRWKKIKRRKYWVAGIVVLLLGLFYFLDMNTLGYKISAAWDAQRQDVGDSILRSARDVLTKGEITTLPSEISPPMIAGISKSKIQVWNAESGELMWSRNTDNVCRRLALSPSGDTLVSVGEKGIRQWNMYSGNLIRYSDLKGWSNVQFSKDGNRLLFSDMYSSAEIIDSSSGIILQKIPSDGWGFTSALSQNGELVACFGQQGIAIWNVDSGLREKNFSQLKTNRESVCFAPDNKSFAFSASNNSVNICDIMLGKQRIKLSGHTDSVLCVCYSPNGNKIATASADNTVKIWDAVSGELIKTLEGHKDGVLALSFSEDGKKILSCSLDNNLILWDIDQGKAVQVIQNAEFCNDIVFFTPAEHK